MTVAGSLEGFLYIFRGRNCYQVIHGHHGRVDILNLTKLGLLSGGTDGKVRRWELKVPFQKPGI